MLLKHFFIGKIAHSSYILAGKNSCAVIDPQRDVDVYIAEARAMGVDITHILQTHLHADFVSGHIDLAKRPGQKFMWRNRQSAPSTMSLCQKAIPSNWKIWC